VIGRKELVVTGSKLTWCTASRQFPVISPFAVKVRVFASYAKRWIEPATPSAATSP
jgi:hypothetical protein